MDLVAEFIKGAEEGKMLGPEILIVSTPYPLSWEIYIDGVAN